MRTVSRYVVIAGLVCLICAEMERLRGVPPLRRRGREADSPGRPLRPWSSVAPSVLLLTSNSCVGF